MECSCAREMEKRNDSINCGSSQALYYLNFSQFEITSSIYMPCQKQSAYRGRVAFSKPFEQAREREENRTLA